MINTAEAQFKATSAASTVVKLTKKNYRNKNGIPQGDGYTSSKFQVEIELILKI